MFKNDAQYQKKTVLITGSNQGLGFAIASLLDAREMQLLLVSRTLEKLERSVATLIHKELHDFQAIDLMTNNAVASLIYWIENKHIIPDVIIHNLGGKIDCDMQPLSIVALEQSLKLNLGIAAEINQYFLPKMVAKGAGRVIHISSNASFSGNSAPGYVAAKAAINGYVKSTARFYAKHNIMICAILPGIIDHDGSVWSEKKRTQPEYYRKRISEMPLQRFNSPDEVATVIGDIVCSDNMIYAGSLIELAAGV